MVEILGFVPKRFVGGKRVPRKLRRDAGWCGAIPSVVVRLRPLCVHCHTATYAYAVAETDSGELLPLCYIHNDWFREWINHNSILPLPRVGGARLLTIEDLRPYLPDSVRSVDDLREHLTEGWIGVFN